MDLYTDMIVPFVAGYEHLLLGLFGLAICMMITRNYSQGLFAFSFVSVVLSLLTSNGLFFAVAIASVLVGSVIKNYGL